jgi:hypothetical protein
MRVCALDALVAIDAQLVLCDALNRHVILSTRVASFDPTNSPWSSDLGEFFLLDLQINAEAEIESAPGLT